MTGGAKYLRAADIVRLTGISIRTVRRWIADEIIPSTSSAAPGSWRGKTLNAGFAHLLTQQRVR